MFQRIVGRFSFLAILGILVHLSDVLPNKYVLGSADLPDDVSPDFDR